MIKLWAIAVSLFALFNFIFWKVTNGPIRKEYGERLFKRWDSKLYYWQGAIYVSSGLTVLILWLLNKGDLINF